MKEDGKDSRGKALAVISKRSLFEETKAISIPEKNAEKAIVISISMMMPIMIN